MANSNTTITVIGAGLTGPLVSVYLAQRGFSVDLYERRPDIRNTQIPAGRSINLALSKRGLFALENIGLGESIKKMVIPMKGRMIHYKDGSLDFQPYGKDDSEMIYSISRAELNRVLLSKADEMEKVSIRFDAKCLQAELDQKFVIVEKNGQEEEVEFQFLIGADGAGSSVRESMEKSGLVQSEFEPLGHGYKELVIPANASGKFVLESNVLHIWPRKSFMLIALPNLDKSFTCTLFLPQSGNPSFESLQDHQDIMDWFTSEFPDAIPLIPNLSDDWNANPVGNLGTVRCSPWLVNDHALLIGDAAHAIVPFFGQGMNAAFEDCSVLNALFEKGNDIESVFKEFSENRKTDADAIADMALENYVEMRDKVADPKYLKHRKIEKILELEFPQDFIPRYSMVSFHRIPYSEVRRKGNIQKEIIEAVSSASGEESIDLELAKKLIAEKL